jgi:hypothetical protein
MPGATRKPTVIVGAGLYVIYRERQLGAGPA